MSEHGNRKGLMLRSLEPTRFEDLVASLVFPLTHWVKLRRTDAKQSAEPSLVGVESLTSGLNRTWWIKIYRTDGSAPRSLSTLTSPLLAAGHLPHVLLLVLDDRKSTRLNSSQLVS